MTQVYARQFTEIVTTGHSLKVKSDPIEAGYVLLVKIAYFHVPEREANDEARLYIEHGAQEITLAVNTDSWLKTGVAAPNRCILGELDRLVGYAPDADNGDTLTLNIVGTLTKRDTWEKR